MSGINTIDRNGVDRVTAAPRAAIRSIKAERPASLAMSLRSKFASKAMLMALSVPGAAGLQGCLPDRYTEAELNAKIAAAQCEDDGGGMIKGNCYIPGLGDISGTDGNGYDGSTRRGGDSAFADGHDGGTDESDAGETDGDEDAADGKDAGETDGDEDAADGEETNEIGPVIDIIDLEPTDIVEIDDDVEIDSTDNGASEPDASDVADDVTEVNAEDIIEVTDDVGLDSTDNGSSDVDSSDVANDVTEVNAEDIIETTEDVGLDSTDNGSSETDASDVADDVGVDAITDSVTDAGIDGATDSVDGSDAADNGATDSIGDITDVKPADIASDVTGADGFIDSDGDGVMDSSGDSTDTGADIYVPKMCEGQPNGKIKPFYTGKPGTQGVGECAPGLFQCTDGTWINIDNEIVPVEEGAKCDGLDNDCDGLTDETEIAVGSAIGECKQKIEGCVNGQWGTKQEAGLPKAETCDNKDNDCNGKTDDNGLGVPLSKTVSVSPFDGVGICKAQDEVCDAGNWKVVKAGVGPKPKEIYMNGIDDNCNGKTDIEEPNGTCDGNNDGLVDIEKFDPGFKAAVFAVLGKANDTLTEAEALKVTALNLSEKGLTTLNGAECFVNLTSLTAYNNKLSDSSSIMSIMSLPLNTLYLHNNLLSDASIISKIATLEKLRIDNNPIPTVIGFEKLVKLSMLYAGSCLLKDIDPLIKNPGLGKGDEVDLGGNNGIPQNQVDALKAKGVTVYF